MKISLIGPVYPYRGGIAHYTASLAQAMSEFHVTQLISFKSQYPRWLYPGESDKDFSQQPLAYPAAFLLEPFNPISWLNSLRALEAFTPDLVVLQWWTTFWAPAFGMMLRWLARAKISTIVLVHNVLPHEPKLWDMPLTQWAWHPQKLFLVQTQLEETRARALKPNALIKITSHPVYHFKKHEFSPKTCKARLGVPIHQPLILFFGLVRPYKGLQYLLEAAALLKQEKQIFYCLVAGEFWESRKKYEDQIRVLGITDCVRLDDRYVANEEIEILFMAADIFVAPYIGGTQSGAVSMAIGFGTPIVITQEAWLPNDKNYPAQCVPPADAAALAKALHFQLAKPAQRHQTQEREPSWHALIQTIESFVQSGNV